MKENKRIRNIILIVIAVLICNLISGAIGGYAVTAINGSDVVYSNKSTTLQAGNVQSAIDELYVAASASFLDRMYPVGSIYISTSLSSTTAVANALGGTWESFGSGRTLVGVDTSQTEFNTILKTGGEKTHTLTTDEMPSHYHVQQMVMSNGGVADIIVPTNSGNRAGSKQPFSQADWETNKGPLTTTSAGGSQSHNNLQPYITVYMYKKTK